MYKEQKYIENILFFLAMVVVAATTDLKNWMFLVFFALAIIHVYRYVMLWKYAHQNKTYYLEVVTCGLFIVGGSVYGALEYVEVV
ncbi:DUF4181 domain-containing protein [Paraliobacillus ryukyuensis]|uniref:DUF4181 domain-containing protein n=1 Tax=Paraliobacillus ryukyuensis TaxID=200904 RepID=UPI0009A7AA8D